MRWLYLMVLLGSLGLLQAGDPVPFGGATVTLHEFILREFKANGEPAWTLTGEQAYMEGNQVRLKGVLIRYFDPEGEVVIRSPGCEFDRLKRTARSDQPITMERHNLMLEGVGYDLDVASQRLLIRKDGLLKVWRTPVAELGVQP